LGADPLSFVRSEDIDICKTPRKNSAQSLVSALDRLFLSFHIQFVDPPHTKERRQKRIATQQKLGSRMPKRYAEIQKAKFVL
jgi:hypothetical protein